MQISDVEFSVAPKCKFWKLKLIIWNENANFGNRNHFVGAQMQISGINISLLVPKYQGRKWPRWRLDVFCAQFSLEEEQKRVAVPHTGSCCETESIHPTAVGPRT